MRRPGQICLTIIMVFRRRAVTSFQIKRVRSIWNGSIRSCESAPISAIGRHRSWARSFVMSNGGNPNSLRASSFSSLHLNNTTKDQQPGPDDGKIVSADWRQHPSINPTFTFPTWLVPPEHIQTILKGKEFRHSLASSFDKVQPVHPRIKLVRSNADGDGFNDSNDNLLLVLRNPASRVTPELETALTEMKVVEGPAFTLELPYTRWTYQYILTKLLPKEVQPPPTSFEQVGHLAHLNLKPHHEPYGKLIGDVLLDRHSKIETVVSKNGEVKGPYRTFDMNLLAGKNKTKVDMVENGIKLSLDVAKVYWCSRLSGERRLFLNDYVQKGQTIADPFCGVGALCMLAAKEKKCKILANDWNADAVNFCKENAVRNGVEHLIQARAGDAYDFLMDLGLEAQQGGGGRLPHHVVMNYPLEAPRFLSALRWWPVYKRKKAQENDDTKEPVLPMFHVYTFARADKDNGQEGGRDAATVAMDLVAHHLLPEGGATEPTKHRQEELNRFGCDMQAREVRDVAPGKLVICVMFRTTPKLLQHMQGDFT